MYPNLETDLKGYNDFIAKLHKTKNMTDEDAKKYSINSDFEIIEGHYY
ncbi:hypothetical protein G1K66_06690 [Tenacibaculum finnmarkense]|nr:hypothetical protein [Tenacibaculum finnmarkense]MBE7634276.1 hypothetical protein [Tenacibaculum finnmarkense genomovar ulcerans]MCD8430224.1 hypothetical protein [Tenacibaculum finnmarkense genomovar ulcerans]MCG8812954.1 hypothetical protein [Tenacibaculum finnmarkense]